MNRDAKEAIQAILGLLLLIVLGIWQYKPIRLLLFIICWLIIPGVLGIIGVGPMLLSNPQTSDEEKKTQAEKDSENSSLLLAVGLFFLLGVLFLSFSYSIPYEEGFDLWGIDSEAFWDTVLFSFFMWLLGLIPAAIANHKGRNVFVWWFYGTLLWIVAVTHSSNLKTSEAILIKRGINKKCPHCAEPIKAEAAVCRYCGNRLN